MKRVYQIFKDRLMKGRGAKQGFSVICAFNDEQKLNTYLMRSLREQTIPFELLAIDNTTGLYPCAAGILNETAKKARHDYLMFVHQDVALLSPKWLKNAANVLRKLPAFGAAGVAGKSAVGLPASVYHGSPPFSVSPTSLKRPVAVQTLDGCLMIVSRNIFSQVQFDEKTCDSWYFYVANFCLDLARLGYKIYVLPQKIYHESTGPVNRDVFEKTRQAMIRKHRNHTAKIYTTMGDWETQP